MMQPGESSAEILSRTPGVQRAPFANLELFQRKQFLPPALCAALIELIEAGRRPSTIADANGDALFRTSETCDLDPDHPAVRELESRLVALNEIDPAHGEPVQGQRYAPGREFKPHTDYFDPDGADWEQYRAVSGQRTWTFMIYLNSVEAGGGTRFVAAKKIVQPEAGKLLAWNNRRAGGEPNPATLHHGMKVRRGVKYVITKWYRERPWR